MLVSAATWLLTNLVKAIPAIPVSQGQTGRVRAVAGVVAFLGAAVIAWSDGNIQSVLTPEWIAVTAQAGVAWILAHYGWKLQKWLNPTLPFQQ